LCPQDRGVARPSLFMSRKSLDPAAWAKWNTCTLRDPKETKECTVWFWRYIPDPVILALGEGPAIESLV
jgi:hypothetical protein